MISQQPGFEKIKQIDLEKIILDRIIHTQESYLWNLLAIKKIDDSYFSVDLHRSIFNYINSQFESDWTIPSDLAIESAFWGYVVSPISDSISKHLDELIFRWTMTMSNKFNSKITESLSKWKSPIDLVRQLEAIYTIPRSTKEESYFVTKSENFVKSIEDKINSWEDFTWLKVWLKYIDEDFAWIQPTDFIWILADEKMWKSWFTLWLANQLRAQWKNVLFFSPEMDNIEVEQRLHLLSNQFNSKDFFQWNLSPEQFVEWRKKNKEMKKNLDDKMWWEIISIDDIELADFNLSTIKARLKKIDTTLREWYKRKYPDRKEYFEKKEHLVDCIIVDWFHLLNWTDLKKWASEWKESQLVSQWLRSLARIEKVPILVSLHTNRDKQKAEEKIIPDARDTSMTASLWRDLTCLLSLFSTKHLRNKGHLWMSCPLSRRSSKGKIWTLDFRPEDWIVSPIQKIQSEQEFMNEQLESDLGGDTEPLE